MQHGIVQLTQPTRVLWPSSLCYSIAQALLGSSLSLSSRPRRLQLIQQLLEVGLQACAWWLCLSLPCTQESWKSKGPVISPCWKFVCTTVQTQTSQAQAIEGLSGPEPRSLPPALGSFQPSSRLLVTHPKKPHPCEQATWLCWQIERHGFLKHLSVEHLLSDGLGHSGQQVRWPLRSSSMDTSSYNHICVTPGVEEGLR